MALATATPDGRPSVRTVLLRGIDERGFTFFTNYESRKGHELAANPTLRSSSSGRGWSGRSASRGESSGPPPRSPTAISSADRPARGSAPGHLHRAGSSPTGTPSSASSASSRTDYPEGSIPRPPSWGGYRLVPDSIEFWQGRPSRLHDRLRYTRHPRAAWLIERLAP